MSKKYDEVKVNRITKAFWTLNKELKPETRVAFERMVDATELDQLRENIKNATTVKPSYTTLITKAASIVLAEYPYANRALIGFPCFKKLIQFNAMDITVAVERSVTGAEQHIVLADTINDVDIKSIIEIHKELNVLSNVNYEDSPRWQLFHRILTSLPVFISKWVIRMPSFSPSLWVKHRGGACMVNSPAKYGIDSIVVDQIWPLTVSFGWIKERPIVVNGEIAVRKTLPLIIFFDRRVMVGAPAARFFNRLAEVLEHAMTHIR